MNKMLDISQLKRNKENLIVAPSGKNTIREMVKFYHEQFIEERFKRKEHLYNFFNKHSHANKMFDKLTKEIMRVEKVKPKLRGDIRFIRSLTRSFTREWCIQLINLRMVQIDPTHQRKIITETQTLPEKESDAGIQNSENESRSSNVTVIETVRDAEKLLEKAQREKSLNLDASLLEEKESEKGTI